MIKPIVNIRRERLLYHQETGVYYRRIVGGIGWPWEPEPGYLVVLGEQYGYDHGLKGRPLAVLAERPAASVTEAHRLAVELRYKWGCDLWLADMEQKEAVRLFRRLNEDGQRGSGVRPLWLTKAPYSQAGDKLVTLFQLLGTVQSPDRKLLAYGAESQLPGRAMGLNPEDLRQPPARFPALAALGFAVAEMVLRAPVELPAAGPRVVTEWDLYA